MVASRPASRGLAGRDQRVGQRFSSAPGRRRVRRRPVPGVEHRLVARLGLAARHDAVEAGTQRGGQLAGVALRCRRAPPPMRRKKVPYSGPLAPPTVDTSVIPTLLSSAPRRCPAGSRPARPRRPSCPRSMFAPWSASPIAESSSVSSPGARRRARRTGAPIDRGPPWSRCRRAIALRCPSAGAGVLTGASHSASISSSTLSSVTDVPAISSEVMYGPTSDRATLMPCPARIRSTSLYIRYSSISGVPPRPLTNAITASPERERQIGQDRLDQHRGDLLGRCQRDPSAARLAVDADAELHLVVAELEGRLARRPARCRR